MARTPLIDTGVEVLRLALSLPGACGSDAAALRNRCEGALSDFAAASARAGHEPEAVDAARYAYVALIDERILSSNAPLKAAWLDQPLQLRLFDSFAAGEEFYTRLDRWRRPRRAEDADVLEVYHACLALGFRGRHADANGESLRRQLAEQVAGEVLAARSGLPAEGLSPRWLPEGATAGDSTSVRVLGLPVWAIPILCLLVTGAVWLLARMWLGHAAESVLREIR